MATEKKSKKDKPFDVKAFAIATLRRASYRLKSRSEALKAARIARNQYKCAMCGKIFKRKEVQLDHVIPVVPLTGWDNFDGFIIRLFVEHGYQFQVICREEHKAKTKEENRIRRENVKAKQKE